MSARVLVYPDEGGEWRWRDQAGNHEIEAVGESHPRKEDAIHAALTQALAKGRRVVVRELDGEEHCVREVAPYGLLNVASVTHLADLALCLVERVDIDGAVGLMPIASASPVIVPSTLVALLDFLSPGGF